MSASTARWNARSLSAYAARSPTAAAAPVASANGRSAAHCSAGTLRASRSITGTSIMARTSASSASSRVLRSLTRKPRFGTTRTAPSSASCCIASRTGVAETPKRSPSAGAE